MQEKLDKRYQDIIDKIGDKVYEFYNLSGRKDLVMEFDVKKELIYSYVYADFVKNLHPQSQVYLKIQYDEALESGRIVLFIRDEEMQKVKSFVI
jgi:hypothetical protein